MKVLRANGMDGKNELPHLVRVLPLVMLQTVFGFLFWPVTDSDLAPGQFVFQFAFKDGSKKPNDSSPNVNEAAEPVLELGGPKGQGSSKHMKLEQRKSFLLIQPDGLCC